VSDQVPHLDRAVDLLWQAGHPRIAEALKAEVQELADKAYRFERILYPRAVPDDATEKETA